VKAAQRKILHQRDSSETKSKLKTREKKEVRAQKQKERRKGKSRRISNGRTEEGRETETKSGRHVRGHETGLTHVGEKSGRCELWGGQLDHRERKKGGPGANAETKSVCQTDRTSCS